MSSRERILAACAHAQPDHVPLHLDVHPSYQAYEPRVATWRDQFERADAVLALGADAMVEVWLPEPSFHPDVKVREWREPATGSDSARLCKEYETPAGVLRQVIRETPDLYAWHKINRNTRGPVADLVDGVGLMEDVNPSRSVEFPIQGPDDLAKMRYLFRVPEGEELQRWRRQALYAKRRAEETQTVCLARRIYAGSAVLWLTDVQETMLTYQTNPEFVQEFLDILHAWHLQLLDLVLDIGVDIVTRFGYYDSPNFWGREYFVKYLKPIMDREAEVCEQAGAYLSQQQSEGITQLVDVYKGMKVHILREVDPVQGDEDLALLKRELGATKTLMGGVNCDVRLAQADEKGVDDLVRETLALMAPGGRFILHPIPGVYAGVPWQKVLWLIDAWKRYA